MKCKVINSSKTMLESDINKWLQTGKYEITNIIQTQESSYITLTIFYLELNEVRKKKLDNLNKNDNNSNI